MADLNLFLKKIGDVDDDELAGESGSGDGGEMVHSSSTTGSPLIILSEMTPAVDVLVDDETNIYLYVMAASVAGFVFIVVVAIVIVFLRRQAQDKKKLQCDRNDLQTITVQNRATSKPGNQNAQSAHYTFPPDSLRQARTTQGDNPSQHYTEIPASSHMQ